MKSSFAATLLLTLAATLSPGTPLRAATPPAGVAPKTPESQVSDLDRNIDDSLFKPFYELVPEYLTPSGGEYAKARQTMEAMIKKASEDPSVVQANAEYKQQQKAHGEAWKSKADPAKLQEANARLNSAYTAYREEYRGALERMKKQPEYLTASSLVEKLSAEVRGFFDYHPAVLAAHKAYLTALAEVRKRANVSVPIGNKVIALRAKNKGKSTAETVILDGKDECATSLTVAASEEAKLAGELYAKALIRAARVFPSRKSTAAAFDSGAPGVSSNLVQAAKAASLRAYCRELETTKTPEITTLYKTLGTLTDAKDKALAKYERALRDYQEKNGSNFSMTEDGRVTRYNAASEAWSKASNTMQETQSGYLKARSAWVEAAFTHAYASDCAVTNKLPCAAAPAVAKVMSAYYANPFDRAALDTAIEEYKAQAKPVPEDATVVDVTKHWPELIRNGMGLWPITVRPSANQSSQALTESPAPLFRWYLWTKPDAGKAAVKRTLAGSPVDGVFDFDNSPQANGALAAAEIKAHAKMPGYPALTFAKVYTEAKGTGPSTKAATGNQGK